MDSTSIVVVFPLVMRDLETGCLVLQLTIAIMVFAMRLTTVTITTQLRFVLLFLLALAVFSVVGCGGDEDLLEGLDLDFDEEGVLEEGDASEFLDDTIPRAFARLEVAHDRLLRIAYVHDMRSLIREIQVSNRDLIRLSESSTSDVVSLDWVADMHDSHRVSEELRIRVYGYSLPDSLVTDYVDFHAAFLEGVQVYSQGADRLLQAAILLGPTGRSLK